MTLRIQTDFLTRRPRIRLIGRIRSEHLQELRDLVTKAGAGLVLDLNEVTLVDVDAVKFLGACEAQGAELLHCSRFIRKWMLRELAGEAGK